MGGHGDRRGPCADGAPSHGIRRSFHGGHARSGVERRGFNLYLHRLERIPVVCGPAWRSGRWSGGDVVRGGSRTSSTAARRVPPRAARVLVAEAEAGSSMTICDISPFYCEKGGGIRTFHRARLDWFARQTRHRYVLIVPGRRFAATRYSPHAWVVQVYGCPLST